MVVAPFDVVSDALVATKLRQRLTGLPGRVDVRVALPLDVELPAEPEIGNCNLHALFIPALQGSSIIFGGQWFAG